MGRTTKEYFCPRCKGPLRSVGLRASDWFCRACGTAVVMLDGSRCLYWTPGAGSSEPITVDDLARGA